LNGGPGSGNFGHAGRPGEVGGSRSDGSSPFQYELSEGASIQWGYAGDPNNFNIVYANGSRVTGIISTDFPNDKISETRGEIWYAEVPKGLQKKGIGFEIVQDALNILRSKGMRTVNLSSVSGGGRALIEKLVREKEIGKKLRESTTGKAEYILLGR